MISEGNIFYRARVVEIQPMRIHNNLEVLDVTFAIPKKVRNQDGSFGRVYEQIKLTAWRDTAKRMSVVPANTFGLLEMGHSIKNGESSFNLRSFIPYDGQLYTSMNQAVNAQQPTQQPAPTPQNQPASQPQTQPQNQPTNFEFDDDLPF